MVCGGTGFRSTCGAEGGGGGFKRVSRVGTERGAVDRWWLEEFMGSGAEFEDGADIMGVEFEES